MNEDSIFAGALEMASAQERAAFLDGACAGNEALRARVEALLAVHEKPDSLLDEPLVAVPTTAPDDRPVVEQPGTQIGRYKLLQQIGEGGFGVVYMAEQQEPVQRRVALKIIKPGMDSRAVIARFEAERQALALMDHPNIAKVLDAGTTESGRPYFVMELVHGIPITKYCDDDRLSPRERLELFIPVCHAIQHAHQKGIIHRDIKPSNILVCLYDGVPVPKVIDFGVAKAVQQRLTQKTMFTHFGQVIGTLEYMSPEQAEMNQLDIDTRADVYSLGAVLYELLAGSPPFERRRLRSAAFDEVLRIIREEDPPRPSLRLSSSDQLAAISARRQTDPAKLPRFVRGELDWIVMKALEKERGRRYDTPNSLVDDVQRFLRDEAVIACPPSRAYRVRKLVRRNKGSVMAAALVLIVLIGGAIGTTIGMIRANNATAQKEEQRLVAVKEKEKSEAVVALLEEMLGSSDPHRTKGADYTVRQLLDEHSARLGEGLEDQPEVEQSLRRIIGKAYFHLDMQDDAERHHTEALRLRRMLYGEKHLLVAESLQDYGWVQHNQGKYAESEQTFRRALKMQVDLVGERSAPAAKSMDAICDMLRHQGKYDQAEPIAIKAIEIQRDVLGNHHEDLACTVWNYGLILREQGKADEAIKSMQEALAIYRFLHEGEKHPDISKVLVGLSESLRWTDSEEAEKFAREAFEINRVAYGESHGRTISAMRHIVGALLARGKFDAAEKWCRNALAATQGARNEDKQQTAYALGDLAFTLKARAEQTDSEEDYQAAELALRDAIAAHEKAQGSGNESNLRLMDELGYLYWRQREYDKAKEVFQKYVEMAVREHGEVSQETLHARSQLAAQYRDNGDPEAYDMVKKCLELSRQLHGDDHKETLYRLGELAFLLKARAEESKAEEDFQAAESALGDARAAHERVLGSANEATLRLMNGLGHLHWLQREYGEAKEIFQEYVEINVREHGEVSQETLDARSQLAAQYRDNDDPEAYGLVKECLELSRQIHVYDHDQTRYRLGELAMICLRLGNLDEAEKLYHEAINPSRDLPDESKLENSKRMRGLGEVYRRKGKLTEAEEVLREALAVQESLAADSLELAFTRIRIGATLTQKGKADEAEPMLRDALRAFEKFGKPDDWRFADAQSVLGECLASLGKYDQAELHLLAAYESLHEEVVGPPRFAHWGAEITLDRIVAMYERSGKDELADQWRRKPAGGPESRKVDEP